jgi:hypothetical protein
MTSQEASIGPRVHQWNGKEKARSFRDSIAKADERLGTITRSFLASAADVFSSQPRVVDIHHEGVKTEPPAIPDTTLVKKVLQVNPRFDLSPFAQEADGTKRMLLNFISDESPSETNTDVSALLKAVVFYDKDMPVGHLTKRSKLPVEAIVAVLSQPFPYVTTEIDVNEEMWVRMDPEFKSYVRHEQKAAKRRQSLEERAKRELEQHKTRKGGVVFSAVPSAD